MGRIPGKIPVKSHTGRRSSSFDETVGSKVKKFTQKRFKVVVISTVSNLNGVKIEDIQEADIVVVASNIFKSNVYFENLQLLVGAGELPAWDARYFDAQLEKTLEPLKAQVDHLQDEGSSAVMKELKEAQS